MQSDGKRHARTRAEQNGKFLQAGALRALVVPGGAAGVEMCQDLPFQTLSLGYDKSSKHLKLK